ncbi:GerMN domain-containing protein [Pseudobutyrivibrio xylanivorans]|uniref:GerMN domain-containing protein n=1 Tax=Pseudobutyrivibrio xylanivorans TaxID=185007 RepID=A0A5P6VS30_PSEXY|nr:GerMN domain-containing protein [Pseudobutyrivibrio xylanivorans]QFJ55443.1 GerMN domain-containing protein [Pseudobutyrivibrio xylanivorans]
MKRLISVLLIFALMFSFAGCGNTSDSSGTKVYYVNTDKTGITPVDYELKGSNSEKQIDELLAMLGNDTDNIDYITTIPRGVELSRWDLIDGSLTLYFVGDYDSLDTFTEILVRAAIVKTMAQVEDVKTVTFYINNAPLLDSNGDAVGVMSADAFIEDFGQETDSLLSTDLILYFASADGMSVVGEPRHVYYSRNVSIEKVVMEQLLKGPEDERLLSSIPNGTKLNSVSISESGVCIVNLDAAFETAVTGVTEQVTIYSIVNTLTELDSIKQVQILVNGATPHISNVDADLASAISRNEAIISDFPVEDEDSYIEEEDYLDIDETSDSEAGNADSTESEEVSQD